METRTRYEVVPIYTPYSIVDLKSSGKVVVSSLKHSHNLHLTCCSSCSTTLLLLLAHAQARLQIFHTVGSFRVVHFASDVHYVPLFNVLLYTRIDYSSTLGRDFPSYIQVSDTSRAVSFITAQIRSLIVSNDASIPPRCRFQIELVHSLASIIVQVQIQHRNHYYLALHHRMRR